MGIISWISQASGSPFDKLRDRRATAGSGIAGAVLPSTGSGTAGQPQDQGPLGGGFDRPFYERS